jgi:hypothetical protein
MANMIAIRAHSCARARDRARARARARDRDRDRITGPAQLHSKVGLGSNEYNSTAGCFRLRARARFTEHDHGSLSTVH